MREFDNIYLYHLDAEVQKMFIRENSYDMNRVRAIFLNVVKFAFLLCKNNLYVPLSNYLESPLGFDCINYFRKLEMEINPIVLLSTAPNLQMAFKKKEEEHSEEFFNPNYRYCYFINEGAPLPGQFMQRKNSASNDIKNSVISSVGSEIWVPFKQYMSAKMDDREKDEALNNIPEILGRRAYISDYITPSLVSNDDELKYALADKAMNRLITKWYLDSFLKEFNAVCFKDIPYIMANEILPELEIEYYPSYTSIAKKLQSIQKLKSTNQTVFQYIVSCEADELVGFKYSEEWKRILLDENEIDYKLNSIGKTKKGIIMEDNKNNVEYGIITALPEEYIGILSLFESYYEEEQSKETLAGGNFVIGKINNKYVALAMIAQAGETDAALYVNNMKSMYVNLKYVFMTGIAGGDPQKTNLGDVVVATGGVKELDYGKKVNGEFIIRNMGEATSVGLVEKTKLLIAKSMIKELDFDEYHKRISKFAKGASFSKPDISCEKYQQYNEMSGEYEVISRKASDKAKVINGVVGSANCVLKDPSIRDDYVKNEEITAFEMEAAGVNRAVQYNEIHFITVRGISDFCDECKNDDWHNYAAANAAIITIMLIELI